MSETIELKLTFSHHKVGEPLPNLEEYIIMMKHPFIESLEFATFSTGRWHWAVLDEEYLDTDAYRSVGRGDDFWYAELPEIEYPTEEEPEDDSDRAYEERRDRAWEG